METNQIITKITDMALAYAPKVLLAILTLIIGFWIISKIVKVASNRFENSGMDLSLSRFLSSLISIALKIMLLLSVVSMFGVNTTSFIAILGALMVGIGMALNGTIGHFASGVLIMIFKPFKVNDLVDLGGNVGTVEAINAFNTTLRTLDNKRIIIGNSTVTSNIITNISGQGTIGVDMTFGIGYSDDIDTAKEVLDKITKNCKYVLKDPPPLIKVSELADSSVNFLLRPWCKSEHYWDVYFYFQENVKKEFDKAGVGIPFPQMDVHLMKN